MNNKENRKLSAILAMDVVGYFSKMADDDEGTLKLLAERRLIIEKHTKSHGGRIFNTAGDAFMIDFSSPVEAVEAAIKIQQEIFNLMIDCGYESYLLTNAGFVEEKRPLTLPKYDNFNRKLRTCWKNHFFTKKNKEEIKKRSLKHYNYFI